MYKRQVYSNPDWAVCDTHTVGKIGAQVRGRLVGFDCQGEVFSDVAVSTSLQDRVSRYGARLQIVRDTGRWFFGGACEYVGDKLDYAFRLGWGNGVWFFKLGKGYRFPTFNELYWQGPWAMGNPDLLSEEVYEVSIGRRELRLFASYAARSIQWIMDDDWIYRPVNVDSVWRIGGELSLEGKWWKVYLSGVYGKSSAGELVYVPWVQGRLEIGNRYIRAEVYGRSPMYTDVDGDSVLPGVVLIDVGGSVPLKDGWQLSVKLENVMDQPYETILGYPLPGRRLKVACTYSL